MTKESAVGGILIIGGIIIGGFSNSLSDQKLTTAAILVCGGFIISGLEEIKNTLKK